MKTRTIKELLQLMLDNKRLFTHGLCIWSNTLYNDNLITYEERSLLWDYIRDNKPKNSLLNPYMLFNTKFYYYWIDGCIRPRIKWLKHHILIN